MRVQWTLCLLAAVCRASTCLTLLAFRVEERAVVGRGTLLVCEYDLQGDRLYAVKWYKDGREFYRYVPEETPAVAVFGAEGERVDVARSSGGVVALRAVDATSGGVYRCEVTAEAPAFATVNGHGWMSAVPAPATPESAAAAAGRPVGDVADDEEDAVAGEDAFGEEDAVAEEDALAEEDAVADVSGKDVTVRPYEMKDFPPLFVVAVAVVVLVWR